MRIDREGTGQITVHPHACGEHFDAPFPILRRGGSSPRVWGTCIRFCIIAIFQRFIPTRVGNITGHLFQIFRKTVHPHACGEHAHFSCSALALLAVHPHACGEHSGNEVGAIGQGRFIPTRVGNILHLPRSIVLSRFIPTRVGNMDAGGETAAAVLRFIPTRVGNIHVDFRKACADSGSSPRVWGTCHSCSHSN